MGRLLGTYRRKLLDIMRISRLSDPLNMFSGRPASVSLLLWRYTDLKHSTQTINTQKATHEESEKSILGLLQSRLLAKCVGVDFGELVCSKVSADQRGGEMSGSRCEL